MGGAVGLQLLLDASDRVTTATLLCTGAAIGAPEGWCERAAAVRDGGIAAMLGAVAARWFGPGFATEQAGSASALLGALRDTEPEG